MTKLYNIGFTYIHKRPKQKPIEKTIVDIYKTYNNVNELVKVRYVVSHNFLGQTVTEHDVIHTTIARMVTK